MSNDTPTPRSTLEGARADLARLRDELKVQVQLGKQEARTLWATLDPKLQHAEQKLDEAAKAVMAGVDVDGARLQAHLGIKELKARWPKVEHGLTDMIEDIRRAAAGARTDLDSARVKAHLAALDADSFAERAGQELKETAEELDRQTEQAGRDLQKSIGDLKRRLMA